MSNRYTPNVWAQWDPLEVLAVGRSYDPEYYEPIQNSQVRDSLQKIAQETEEDYQQLIRTVESFGVTVVRPNLGYRNIEIDISKSYGPSFTAIPKPPMTPRDNAMVLGNQLLITSNTCDEYNSLFYKYLDHSKIINPWAKTKDIGTFALEQQQQFFAPSMTRVGNRIFVDNVDRPWLVPYIKQNFSEFDAVEVTVGGHNDGVFSPIAPGCILSVVGYNIYHNTFPNWDVCYLPNQSWSLVQGWNELKHRNDGKWWIPEQNTNTDLTEFVETWLQNWLGYVEESVFDVNCLVIDRNHVIFSNYNDQVWNFCRKHNIEAIESPFRHRFFWDGGLHCITLDLVRKGTNQNYFQ